MTRCRSCGVRLGRNLRALCSTCAFHLPRETAERLRAAAPEVFDAGAALSQRRTELLASESPLGWRNRVLWTALTSRKAGSC